MKITCYLSWLASSLILLILTAGCSLLPASTPSLSPKSLSGTEWQLIAYGDPGALQFALEDHRPTLKFDETTLGGSSGCNSYGGDYTRKDERISVGDLASTLMACLDDGVMEQESAYLSILSQVEKVQFAGDSLVLSGPVSELHFVPLVP